MDQWTLRLDVKLLKYHLYWSIQVLSLLCHATDVVATLLICRCHFVSAIILIWCRVKIQVTVHTLAWVGDG